MPLLLDSKAESIEALLAEFKRQGILLEQARIVLSVEVYRAPDGKLMSSAVASTKLGAEVLAIPIASFGSFQASLMDGTPMPRLQAAALNGATIMPDGFIQLQPQAGQSEGLVLNNVRLRKSKPSHQWSLFDNFVLQLAFERLPYEVFREYAPGFIPIKALDFERVSAVRIGWLDDLPRRLEHRLRRIRDDELTAAGRAAFEKWQGRASLRQAVARTLRQSGMRPAREPGYGRGAR